MVQTQLSPEAARQLLTLSQCLNDYDGFTDVIGALVAGQHATVEGIWGSSCALLAAEVIRQSPGTTLVVCPDTAEIDPFCDDLALFTTQVTARFSAWETGLGERILHDEIYGERLRLLKMLQSDLPPRAIITSIQSLLQTVPSRQLINQNSRTLAVGQRVDISELLKWLASHGFHGTSAVELPGEFSSRGGILDVFAPDWHHPVRVELFDDEIESIRAFEVTSQRSLENVSSVDITMLLPSEQDQDHLVDYLPVGTSVLLLEPSLASQRAREYLERQDQPQTFHSLPVVQKALGRFATLSAASLAEGHWDRSCRLPIESVERFSGDYTKVRGELDHVGRENQVYVVTQTAAEAERLQEIFAPTELAVAGQLHYLQGRLRQGFRLVGDGVVVISGNELFHRTDVKRMPARRLGKAIDRFLDLKVGDLVVHLAHGIGRYRGLKLLNKEEQVEEHLEIEFYGGTRIYVPSARIDLIQKYVGSSKSRPSLAKIGGKSWVRQTRAAEQAVVDLAAEMLEIQANRTGRSGIAFGDDSHWQQEFDASFPYQETPDQLQAIEMIKSDMRESRPMDRLLCGDVGFGKTELAIRAAFKAIDNGYQVAVLVPTTILAEQHHRTFSERMREFPCIVEKLSRFSSPAQQREVVKGLKEGRVDIVIGTHRLASRDVSFQNLGLLVIDEEQRFGVEVKERLKSLRAEVDVLTMTATPIPRTLHMSMVGIRDISNLQTAPEERISVETRVCRFKNETIRHAVLREVNRGGQVYFVHNRVQDIEALARRLRQVIPEASLRIGHGQMPEGQLEKVMVDFVAGRFDILLATTIVESGLDIPNANTIFIDEADRYGLADLHQLRGRVGRYKHRAYCYLLLDPHKHLSPVAARRLRAIEEFSEMGSGFAISMRDLEIRGAGNLLGTQQSGHIAAVGYELYCQLLENAVRKVRELPPKLTIDVQIDLPGESYIPDEYVPDMRTKIDLYRRMARITTPQELDDFRTELIDRFGVFPQALQRMLDRVALKIEAAVWQIHTIFLESPHVVLVFRDRPRIEQLARSSGGQLRVVDAESAYLRIPRGLTSGDDIVSTVKSVLQPE